MTQVPIQIGEDADHHGGGHARIIFEGLADHAQHAFKVAIRRGSEHDPWLGKRGWQASETEFEPLLVEADADDLALTVGPEVCDQIDQLTIVEVSIPSLDIVGVAPWDVAPAHKPVGAPVRPIDEPPERIKVGFRAGAEGLVTIDDPGQRGPNLPKTVAEDQALLGIDHERLYAARQGDLQIDVKNGEARVLPGPAWPERVRVTFRDDGQMDLSGEGDTDYRETVSGRRPLFGVAVDDIRSAGGAAQAILIVDPKTGLGRLDRTRTDPIRVAFEATAEGDIKFDADSAATAGLPPVLSAGQTACGIESQQLFAARRGALEVNPTTGAATVHPGEDWPRRIAFSLREDGRIDLAEEGGTYRETVSGQRPVFGISPQELRAAAGSGMPIVLYPATARGTLELRPRRRSLWIVLAALSLLALALAALWFWKGDEIACWIDEARCQEPTSEPTNLGRGLTPVPVQPTPPTGECPAAGAGPDEVHACAMGTLGEGDLDRARSLLRQNEDYGPTALYLAQQIDSIDFQEGLFVASDDIEAARLYGIACAQGVAEAPSSLAAVEAVLAQRADQGDRMAGEILRGPISNAREACQ